MAQPARRPRQPQTPPAPTSTPVADGRLTVISGASRCGKTAYAQQAFRSAPRVIAWDIEEQWCTLPGWTRVDTLEALAAAVKPGPCRVAFVPSGDLPAAFAFWAECAFTALDKFGPVVIIGEELADVTAPGKAPQHWGTLVRRGLKRGALIVAISQRWAEADKTTLGNASEFVIFRQSSADDTRYLVRKTRVPAEQIDALAPLEFVRYDALTQTSQPGKVSF